MDRSSDRFIDLKAYEERGMQRRKSTSKQFDGTDVAGEVPGSVGGARGLLRREVSRAYSAVAAAGVAVATAKVDSVSVLLGLMEEQVRWGSRWSDRGGVAVWVGVGLMGAGVGWSRSR